DLWVRDRRLRGGGCQIDDAIFLVDGALWLHAPCHRHRLRLQHVTHGNRNAVERMFSEVK
ncbi:hypothetical protein DJ84_05290, partial [Halorubrum ezzemoulense]